MKLHVTLYIKSTSLDAKLLKAFVMIHDRWSLSVINLYFDYFQFTQIDIKV